jgi:hypothetical protein
MIQSKRVGKDKVDKGGFSLREIFFYLLVLKVIEEFIEDCNMIRFVFG